ncbi:ferrochelatase [Crenobacter sp. SG2303]|uniref:Ferrochelatase n=1 Tax=Crenobacter oryzisoli TaxID=3056844 RepID=A0ABT7XI81_9NEIS|nr:ferrochelatase [Crenobacter sp. SG2303]MDN0073495.1 ferrochelatase [Crenobacter sp. SG2303]
MPRYLPEPPAHPDSSRGRTAILLINLGTPEAPTAKAVRPYLKEFLSDPRVVEIPRVIWWLILNGIILNTRPAKSAEKYASIWTPEGSPLLVHTQRQTSLLRDALAERGYGEVRVEFAMRYGSPSVASVVEQLRADGVERIVALPLYPQYAASSSGTALDQVFRVLEARRNMPELRTVRHFYDHPGYIAALAESVRAFWRSNGRPDKLVMSFHGVPRFTVDTGDPYRDECLTTGRLLAEALELGNDDYRITFQSRFGRAEWLTPYTSEVLAELGRAGTGRIDVMCPGFVADCLETLEEIAMEGKETFHTAGGGDYRFIPCLNESPVWIAALLDIAEQQLAGWEIPVKTQ